MSAYSLYDLQPQTEFSAVANSPGFWVTENALILPI